MAAADELARLERTFQELSRRLAPCVVSLRVERYIAPASAPPAAQGAPIHARPEAQVSAPGDYADAQPSASSQVVVVNGTGTIIDASGAILTNDHVVSRAASIEVRYSDGQRLPGAVAAADGRSDLAIVRTARTAAAAARLVDWSTVQRGQWAFVLGNPFGLGQDGEFSVSAGLISNLGRRLPGLGERDDRLYTDMIQTTAVINPGNSGGPLFNLRGELVGVVTAMHTRSGVDDGAGFAIPLSPPRRQRIGELLDGAAMPRAWLGAQVRQPSASETRGQPCNQPPGVVIEKLEPTGPAALAGLKVGDMLLTIENQPIRGPADFASRLDQLAGGIDVRLTRVRRGPAEEVVVRLERRDAARVSWLRDGIILWRGLRLVELPIDHDQRRPAGAGLYILEVVGDDREIQQLAHTVGDVIESVEGRDVQGAEAFLRQVRDRHEPVRLTLKRSGQVSIPP